MPASFVRSASTSLLLALAIGSASPAFAQVQDDDRVPPPVEAPEALEQPEITGEVLQDIILRIDENAVVQGNVIQFTFAETLIAVVYDENAQRMRAMVPITSAEVLSERLMERMLQANFDSVLDARYAISNGQVWSVFIHPLDTLTEVDFTSGIVQCVIAAQTFGKEFTSGAMVFGGGDSAELNRQLLESLETENDRGI